MAREADLTPGEIAALHECARAAAHNSYSPYSGFRVGAAVLLRFGGGRGGGDDGCGTNVENASYRLTSCAEQAAIAAAVAQFWSVDSDSGHRGGESEWFGVYAVRGVPADDCRVCGPEAEVFYPSASGGVVSTTIGALLPEAFQLKSD